MSSNTATISTLSVAALVALAASVALTRLGTAPENSTAKATSAVRLQQWTATAPGRVEPRNGEIRISVQTPGRVAEIPVKINDKVQAGDLLLRLEDDEARARLGSAEAEASVRKRERDLENAVNNISKDRRTAEDNYFNAERSLHLARVEFDRVLKGFRLGTKDFTEDGVTTARNAVTSAQDRLESERTAMKRAQAAANNTLYTRLESGLANARADFAIAEAAVEHTRVRAPSSGTVLQLNPKAGELAVANPEAPVITIGDLSALRVRAEVEERDISKVQIGQQVVVRADPFPGRDFTGKVTRMAKTMGQSKISQRGPRRPNDLDALEVTIELDTADQLLPGMRVDVMFKPDATAESNPAAAAEPKAGDKAATTTKP